VILQKYIIDVTLNLVFIILGLLLQIMNVDRLVIIAIAPISSKLIIVDLLSWIGRVTYTNLHNLKTTHSNFNSDTAKCSEKLYGK